MKFRYWLERLVQKLSTKATNNSSKAIPRAYSEENMANQRHKFMDGDTRKKLTKTAWKHADKE